MTVCSWTLNTYDTTGKLTSLTFDLVPGTSPLILGMDIRAYCNTFNLGDQKYIKMQRPHDNAERILFTYLVPEDKRLRLDIAPHPRSVVRTLLGNIQTTAQRTPMTFCKKIHRYTHATKDEMRTLCQDARMLDPELEQAIENVCDACEICAKNGEPKRSKKVSLTHVNEAFNQELQIDFIFVVIGDTKYTVMHMTDTGTGYSELALAPDRSMATIIRIIETVWVCKHGAPVAVSADDEYNRSPSRNYFAAHDIQFKPRPARRHNKLGIVERKNKTVKAILAKLNDENTAATPETLISRTAFLSNMFSGNKLLSSFELVRGYSPSVLGIPRTLVTNALLQAHREQIATRTIQRLMSSRAPHVVRPDMFNPGDPVWVFYRTTKQNEKVGWIQATVVRTEDHYLIARRSRRGPPMRIAYEDVRFAPRSSLTAELLSCSLEEELYGDATNPAETDTITPAHPDSPPANATLVEDDDPPSPIGAPTHPPPAHPRPTANPATIPTASSEPPLRLRLQLRTPIPNRRDTLLATETIHPDGGEKDIGAYAALQTDNPIQPTTITRDNTAALEAIHDEIGSKQVSSSQLNFAPPWLVDEALKTEHDANWADAYISVPDNNVPRDANVISSHVVYRIKTDEEGARMLKARIVPHGNHDDEKDDIRKDSSNAPLYIIRLLLSLVTFMGFRIGTADIKGAYLQSGPIKRDIYVRPPRDWPTLRGILWKLLKLPYGIADAGRQWQVVVENWMLTEACLERVFGLPQLFTKRTPDGRICLLVAKVTDDFLLGGSVQEMQNFVELLGKRFIVGKALIDQKIHFDGCELEQDICGNIKMSMIRYLERLKPILISRARRKQRTDKATEVELKQYRSLACTLMYLGNGVLPQASYVASLLQQMVTRVTVEQLCMANEMLNELLKLKPWITFKVPPSIEKIQEVFICTFTDASFNQSTSSGYGQTGTLTGLRTQLKDVVDIFHPIDWCSNKQRRVCYSPYGAEILACAEGDDRGFYFKAGLNCIFPETNLRNELFTDSRCLYDTITTLHEGKDFRLRPTVQRIRNSFDSCELDLMNWLPGPSNPSDALTKRNPNTSALLNELVSIGVMCIDLESGYSLDSATWK